MAVWAYWLSCCRVRSPDRVSHRIGTALNSTPAITGSVDGSPVVSLFRLVHRSLSAWIPPDRALTNQTVSAEGKVTVRGETSQTGLNQSVVMEDATAAIAGPGIGMPGNAPGSGPGGWLVKGSRCDNKGSPLLARCQALMPAGAFLASLDPHHRRAYSLPSLPRPKTAEIQNHEKRNKQPCPADLSISGPL